ncbi:MAG: hypothetical protein ABMA64_04305 [Myxococcota bacterium]
MWWASVAVASVPWWDLGWRARVPFTAPAAASADWPVVARLTDTGFTVDHAPSLRFVVDGVAVPHALTEDGAAAWVSLPPDAEQVWAYWDNPDVAAPDSAAAVFEGFDGSWWHLDGCAGDACPDAAGGSPIPATDAVATDGVVGDGLFGGELVLPGKFAPPFTVGGWFGTAAWDPLVREGLIRGAHFAIGRCQGDELGLFADVVPSVCTTTGLVATEGEAHQLVVSASGLANGSTRFDVWLDGVRGEPVGSLAELLPQDAITVHPMAQGGIGRFVGVFDEVFATRRALDDDAVLASTAELERAGDPERWEWAVGLTGGCSTGPSSAAAAIAAAVLAARRARRSGR